MKKQLHIALIALVFILTIVRADDSIIKIPVKSEELKKLLQAIRELGEPMYVSELAPSEISDSKNAAIPLENAAALMEKLETTEKLKQDSLKKARDDYLNDPANEQKKEHARKLIDMLLEEHKEVFDLIDIATGLGKCRFNIDYAIENPALMKLPHLMCVRNCARLLRYKALFCAMERNNSEAVNTCKNILLLSKYLKDDPFLICYLVEISTISIASHAVEDVLAVTALSVEQNHSLLTSFRETKNALFVRQVFVSERTFGLTMFQLLRSKKIGYADFAYLASGQMGKVKSEPRWFEYLLYYNHIDEDQINYMKIMNKAIEISTMPYKKMQPFLKELTDAENAMTANPRHYFVSSFMIPAVTQLLETVFSVKSVMDAVTLGLQARIYKLEHDAYPESLDKLVENLPLDSFTGKSFIYDKVRHMIYSVGPNQKDDGGVYDGDAEPKKDDRGFRFDR